MQKLTFLLFSLLLSTLCFGSNNNFTDATKTILVSKSAPTFNIRLQANHTTGYSWVLVKYDNSLVQPISHKYYVPQTTLVGAGGYEEWNFEIKPLAFKAPQLVEIQLAYIRPWEVKNYQSVTFKIVTTE